MLTSTLFLVNLLSAQTPTPESQIPADQKLAQSFLENAEKILQQDPADGKFGLSRMPGIHGRTAFSVGKPEEKAAADQWNQLVKDFVPAVLSFGMFDAKGVPDRNSFMYAYYHLNHTDFIRDQSYFRSEREFADELAPEEAKKLFLSGKKTSNTTMVYAKRKAMIEMRTVTAPSDACMSCHEGVPKGKTIGVLALLRIPK